jgi:hypothetical protein
MSIYKNLKGTTSDEFSIGSGINKVKFRINNGKLQGKDNDGEYKDLIINNYSKEVSDLTESSTSSTTFQNKIRLTTDYLPVGKYRVGWSYEWLSNTTNVDFRTLIIVDDSVELLNPNSDTQTTTGSWTAVSSFEYVNFEEGVHDVDIYYKTNKNNKAVNIRNAHIEIWRV